MLADTGSEYTNPVHALHASTDGRFATQLETNGRVSFLDSNNEPASDASDVEPKEVCSDDRVLYL